MKFFAEIVVHQHDSCAPDYQLLHELLADAGFQQRQLDGTRSVQSFSGLYCREEHVLGQAEVEHDLRFALTAFAHPCSFRLHLAADSLDAAVSALPQQADLSSALANAPASSYVQ